MRARLVVLVLVVVVLVAAIAILSGCSARIGPHDDGWLSWDVCGYEGGVAASITIMEIGARLGCSDSPDSAVVEEVIDEPLPEPPTPAPDGP